MGMTSIPCAPSSLSLSITVQNSFSLSTECTELQPFTANGMTVGLFMPGMIEMI